MPLVASSVIHASAQSRLPQASAAGHVRPHRPGHIRSSLHSGRPAALTERSGTSLAHSLPALTGRTHAVPSVTDDSPQCPAGRRTDQQAPARREPDHPQRTTSVASAIGTNATVARRAPTNSTWRTYPRCSKPTLVTADSTAPENKLRARKQTPHRRPRHTEAKDNRIEPGPPPATTANDNSSGSSCSPTSSNTLRRSHRPTNERIDIATYPETVVPTLLPWMHR